MGTYENKSQLIEAIKNGKKDLSQADLSGAYAFDLDLAGAELVGSDMSGCDLTHVNLKRADLARAKITNARLWNADLEGSNLSEADLSGADLMGARLYDAKIWRTEISGVKSLTALSFAKGASVSGARIDESGPHAAEDSYRMLKNYFMQNGMYKDASWASYREKVMERAMLKKKRNFHYLPSLFMGIVCGYGEKPHRIVLAAAFTIIFFAVMFGCLNGVQSSVDSSYAMKWSDYVYYSAVTFTTVGYGDFVPKAAAFFRLCAALEAFLGVFLAGLFVFTLARKYTAR
jgi:hypothetical protein